MKIDREKYKQYDIISSGSISVSDVGESRFIPIIMLDENLAKEVTEIIDFHSETNSGDIETIWTSPISTVLTKKRYTLKLKFTKPQNLTFGISFDIDKHAKLIDGILFSQALYLQTGNIFDKLYNNNKNSILVEVPNTGFLKTWNNIIFDYTKKQLRKKGIPKKELNSKTKEFIKSNREIWTFRS